jgi:hypothetical protein
MKTLPLNPVFHFGHDAGTVCKIRRAAPALVLAEKSVVRAEGLEPSWAV